jgi:transposase
MEELSRSYGWEETERVMQANDVFLEAMAGKISWVDVEEILDLSARTVRRLRAKMRKYGIRGLYDRRKLLPSPKRADAAKVQQVLDLWKKYQGEHNDFSTRHLHQILRRDQGVKFSYTFVKELLQGAGYMKRGQARGKHRKRRQRRPSFGELLHLDGSRHQWLTHRPGEWQTMVAIVDDATGRLLYAQLWPGESTEAVMTGLRQVIQRYGLPESLYTDRARWAAWTPKAGGKVDRSRPTQVARALKQLGVEHILSYSPQARGRSERINGTLQGRLVPLLRIKNIRTMERANEYLREQYLAEYDEEFARPPANSVSAFVPLGTVDLDQILCHQEVRVVARDNTVVLEKVRLQVEPQPGRRTCAGLEVTVRRHLDHTYSIWHGTQRFGRYSAAGRLLTDEARPPRCRSGLRGARPAAEAAVQA